MGNAGMPFYDSIEIDELLHPILVSVRRLVKDSEGAGKFRGAPSIRVEFKPVDCEIELGFVSDGTVNPALGACGGGAAQPARQYIINADGSQTELSTSEHISVHRGQTVVSISSAGGGYGDPSKRAPEEVANDVREGWISAERASDVYGVAFTKHL
jgi:N-methylhydantoinase B